MYSSFLYSIYTISEGPAQSIIRSWYSCNCWLSRIFNSSWFLYSRRGIQSFTSYNYSLTFSLICIPSSHTHWGPAYAPNDKLGWPSQQSHDQSSILQWKTLTHWSFLSSLRWFHNHRSPWSFDTLLGAGPTPPISFTTERLMYTWRL